MKKNFLLFDFDGVLMDSIREAGLSAYNAVTGSNHTTLEEMPENCFQLFYNNRFIFYKPGILFLLMQWCIENYETKPNYILTKDEFKKYIDKETRCLNELGHYFYSVRTNFMTATKEKWVKINHPFQPIWDSVIENGADKVIILTAKNRAAVATLAQHYGLQIKDENIYSGDNGKNKIENFKEILNRFGKQNYLFLDDHLINLVDLDNYFNQKETIINFALCTWGYGWQGDIEEAKKLGYQVISQEQAVQIVVR
jgi:phosphoglycolate phosphatase-like HAD superfamily hydrolase